MIFKTHKNFKLDVNAWGSAKRQDVIMLLDSVITEFYSNLEINLISTKPVQVLNSLTRVPPINNPRIEKNGTIVKIYLNTKDLSWCQYSYQFSHELCHYVIDLDFPPKNDKFGWFEESLCELASLYTLKKMSNTWQSNAPYPNWRGYHSDLDAYASDIISTPENKITKTLNEWLTINLPDLFKCRYDREKNLIVAINLLPLFNANPDLWISIQYLKYINVTGDMTLKQYLSKWEELIPQKLTIAFDNIVNLFET